MKTLLRLALLALVVMLLIPVAAYRTVSPCGMLKKELVAQARESVASVSEAGREQARDLGGEQAERIAEGVGAVVENTMVDIAEGMAEARVNRMSLRECVSELWRIKTE